MADGYPTIEDLNEDILAYRQEIVCLREQLAETLEENEALEAQIQHIGCDLIEERRENATREHVLLRQNTPGLISTPGLDTPVGTSCARFYDFLPREQETTPTSEGYLYEDVPHHRANSVAGIRSDHMDHVDSNKMFKRRSMSYHDIINIHDTRDRATPRSAKRLDSFTDDGDGDYQYDQEVGYFEDELVSSSYYVEEAGECAICRQSKEKEQELESHKEYLEEVLEDKDKFIENLELEMADLKTQLRSLKLDKDIVEYDLNEKVIQSIEELKETTQSLKQKDQAYMDLLERFVNLEKKFEDVNMKYKSNIKESYHLSDKLALTEFDLIMAEERLQRYEKRLFDSDSVSSSSSGSSPASPNCRSSYKYRFNRKFSSHSVSNLEQCSLEEQPLSVSLSDHSLDQSVEEEFQAIENIKKAKKEAEKHAQIQEMLNTKRKVSAYDLFQITKELAGMSNDDSATKENHEPTIN